MQFRQERQYGTRAKTIGLLRHKNTAINEENRLKVGQNEQQCGRESEEHGYDGVQRDEEGGEGVGLKIV